MTTSNQKRANRERTERARWFHLDKPPVERVRQHLERLSRPSTPVSDRIVLWRLIQGAALEAHDQEVRKMDELKAVFADPELLATFGEPVG